MPRPQPSQYAALQSDVASLLTSLGSVPRVLALIHGLQRPGATQSHAGHAAAEASAWCATTGAWLQRLAQAYPAYLDLWQPVEVAVQQVWMDVMSSAGWMCRMCRMDVMSSAVNVMRSRKQV